MNSPPSERCSSAACSPAWWPVPLAFAVAYLLGESKVDAAIAIEEATAHGHDHGEEAPVSRALQATAGLGTGVLLYGVALGGIAALVYCYALGRIGRFGPRATAALVTRGPVRHRDPGAVPQVPRQSPGRRRPRDGRPADRPLPPDDRPQRAAGRGRADPRPAARAEARQLERDDRRRRASSWPSGSRYAFLPGINEVPAGFPAALIWDFRLASLAIQTTLWTTFGLVFGFLAERALVPASAPKEAVQPTS